MTFMRKFICLIPFSLLLLTCSPSNDKWLPLFNGVDLSTWEKYLGPRYDSAIGKWDTTAIGVNNDPRKVFSVIENDGISAIRISGEMFGGISTKQDFKNYHLRLQFKWGQSKHNPKKKAKRDSGLLYHANGRHGADARFWMSSQEFQIQEGDCGDYWGVAGGSFEIPAQKQTDSTFIYKQGQPLQLFNEKSINGRRCIKDSDAERPYGNWNQLELICFGDTAIHILNDKIVMVLFHSSILRNGKLEPLTKGKLQIQSEGAEIFLRNIEYKSIEEIPSDIANNM
jgi:hypothetical protein